MNDNMIEDSSINQLIIQLKFTIPNAKPVNRSSTTNGTAAKAQIQIQYMLSLDQLMERWGRYHSILSIYALLSI